MIVLFTSLILLLLGGLAALLLGKRALAVTVASRAVVLACVLGFGFAATNLWAGNTLAANLPLPLPLGQALFQVDPITCIFLLPTFLISGLVALALPSLLPRLTPCPHTGAYGFFFALLVAGMVLVLTAADGVVFLLAWEIMSLAPFFLFCLHDAGAQSRVSCRVYLIATHLGVLPLLLLFAGMGAESGGSSFFQYAAFTEWQQPGLFFILALLGFGAKLGLAPMQIWMPEAYSILPGQVNAVLAGAVVNMGLYGLIRILSFLGPVDVWWAYTLMGAGALSAIAGIVLALAQKDMKGTLAYSSSEHTGLLCLALGAGLLAAVLRNPVAMLLFFGGAMLHMWNHALFKSLLFYGTGTVEQATGTTLINALGGLQKKMPLTGFCLAIGTASIAALPPFNGFMGELLLFMGFALGSAKAGGAEALPTFWAGLFTSGAETTLVFWAGFFTLAATAGLSLLCFTRFYALTLLGAPRSAAVKEACDPAPVLCFPMLALAGLCLACALATPWLLDLLTPALYTLAHRLHGSTFMVEHFVLPQSVATASALGSAFLLALIGGSTFLLHRIRGKNGTAQGQTWDCGYSRPAASMQYTSGSFAAFPARILAPFLHVQTQTPCLHKKTGFFPSAAKASMVPIDWCTLGWNKLVQGIYAMANFSKQMQHGQLNAYILYMLLTLLLALVWALGVAV